MLAISKHLSEVSRGLSLICETSFFVKMFLKIITCLLIAYYIQLAQCKAWPDQRNYNSYNNSNPSMNWGNPYYGDQNHYGPGDKHSQHYCVDLESVNKFLRLKYRANNVNNDETVISNTSSNI